jgi:hypothetical protein
LAGVWVLRSTTGWPCRPFADAPEFIHFDVITRQMNATRESPRLAVSHVDTGERVVSADRFTVAAAGVASDRAAIRPLLTLDDLAAR